MTNLEVRDSVNYAATVVRVKHVIPLENCDNVVAISVLGYQAIVGKDVQVGDLLVVFLAESQLSDDYASVNNLYRHSEKNFNPAAKGYIEDNRRVRAMKFRGHRSDALAMPLSSLDGFVGSTFAESELTEGDTFDTINGVEICRKYVIKTKGPTQAQSRQDKVFKRVDAKFLPEHYDTENYFRNEDLIGDDEYIVVTQKVHGTSIRISNTIVRRQLKWYERLAKRFGVKVAETEFDYVYGSRKVIKDVNNPNQNHFYDVDLWSTEGAKYADLLPENVIVYGELIGWTPNNAPIQASYTYDVPTGEARLIVYRVAVVTGDGHLYDLSWEAVKEFCRERGLKHVAEVWSGFKGDFDPQQFLDVDLRTVVDNNEIVPLCPASPCDEGVVIRVERLSPRFYKAKSPAFLRHESAFLDEGIPDLESEESTNG